MFHPSILAQYQYARHSQQMMAIDACTDVAEYNRIPVFTLARFLVTMGIDADRLQLLA